jgi:hypothetical protein
MTLFIVILGAGLLIKFIGKSSNPPSPKSFSEIESTTQTHVQDTNSLFCSNCGKPYHVSESKKFCDNCGVSLVTISNQTTDRIVQSQTQTNLKKGVLTITFDGCWTSFFATEIYINNVFRFREMTMSGFSVNVPLESSQIDIETHEKSTSHKTKFKIKDLDIYKNYTIVLQFNRLMHEYSPKYELIETN